MTLEPTPAASLAPGDRVLVDGEVVVLESVLRSGGWVWVRAGGVAWRVPVDGVVERVKGEG